MRFNLADRLAALEAARPRRPRIVAEIVGTGERFVRRPDAPRIAVPRPAGRPCRPAWRRWKSWDRPLGPDDRVHRVRSLADVPLLRAMPADHPTALRPAPGSPSAMSID